MDEQQDEVGDGPQLDVMDIINADAAQANANRTPISDTRARPTVGTEHESDPSVVTDIGGTRPRSSTFNSDSNCSINSIGSDHSTNSHVRLRFGRQRSHTGDRIDEDGFVIIEAENEIEAQKMKQNHMFGFKKWKSHLTARPLEERSEVVQKLYESPNIIKPFVSTLSFGNVLYVILFGWWISLVYTLVAMLMFLTIIGKDYGHFCLKLAWYMLWPFGRFVQKKCEQELQGLESQDNVESEVLEDENIPIAITRGMSNTTESSYCKPSFFVWAVFGLPLMSLVHTITILVSGFFVIFIPVSKMNVIMLKHVLLLPPNKLSIKSSNYWMRSHSKPREVIMCSYQAVNVYYYKFTIDGINIVIVNMLPIVLAAIVLGYFDPHNYYITPIMEFILSLISIFPMSYLIGMAITSISAQSSHAVGAVLNATFGSIVEITLYISTLLKAHQTSDDVDICYVDLVRSALTGTLLATMLLIPGISMVVGGVMHSEQRFNMHSAGVGSSLLFISVAGAFTPTIFTKTFAVIDCSRCNISYSTHNDGDDIQCSDCFFSVHGSNHSDTFKDDKLTPLVYTCTVLLPLAYFIGLVYTLKTHTFIFESPHGETKGSGHHKPIVLWGRLKSCIILLIAVTCMSLCADLVADNIDPLLRSTGLSELFLGGTILALAPSLPEILNGVQFARQNNINMSIEIGSSVAVQVCLLQIPILVLSNSIKDMSFLLVFNDIHLWSVVLSVVIMNYTFIDGKSDYFQGSVLLIVYAILISMFYFAPPTTVCL
ncbi:uncharacterized protein [Antedon mediterranea]|uniref:uncharacterized protein n=1 Tax=Antedon mediterranea TaxID=105859 RepID=UPI003AF6B4BE